MKILYICGRSPRESGEINGGAARHTGLYLQAMQEEKIDVEIFDRNYYLADHTRRAVNARMKDCDLIHCDDTKCLDAMLKDGIIPDIAGPHPRSPIKYYKDKRAENLIQTVYHGYETKQLRIYDDTQWVRLNHQDEPEFLWKKLIIIKGCIDANSQALLPAKKQKRYILWAGTPDRWAKNYDLWLKVRSCLTKLPEGYEIKELLDYKLEDYYSILDECALLVHTGRFESWCFQLHEAWSKEVLTIHKRGLWGDTYVGCGLFCFGQDESPQQIANHILGILELKNQYKELIGKQSREKLLIDCLPEHYGNRWRKIYERVLDRKKTGSNHCMHKPN